MQLHAHLQVEADTEDRDVDSRVAAVRSLALTLQTLGASQAGAQPLRERGSESLAELLQQHALPCLLAALQDYSTDNRGDIGSWVREAGMRAAPDALQLLESAVPTQAQEAAMHTWVQRFVGGLLKQSVERIARVREVAATQLRSILQIGLRWPPLEGAELLQTAFGQQHPAALATLQGLPAVVAILQVPAYQTALLEGLAASIGGLDSSLSKAASAAVLRLVEQHPSSGLADSLLAALHTVWQQHAHSPRLAIALLRTADMLLAETDIGHRDQACLERLLGCVQGETRQCKDVARLCMVATVLCHYLDLNGPLCKSALQSLLGLLMNKYPKVRKSAGEQLYVKLLTLEDHPTLTEDSLEPALEVLSETTWDGSAAEAPNPGPNPVDLNQLSSQPTAAASSQTLAIVFQCRAVGQQIWTTGSDGTFQNTGAQADLWCGPGSAKIAIKHFFSNTTTGNEQFEGGSPTFEAVDGSGIIVAAKLISGNLIAPRSGDGGFGSVGDVLLGVNSARGTFSDVTTIVRNNELGGQLPNGMTPLVNSNTNVENFAPTGAEGVPNAPLFVPYQADYTFITGGKQPAWPQPSVITPQSIQGGSGSTSTASASSSASASGNGSASASANATASSSSG
eukprot:jgi/Astpho2/594/Aster-x0445